MNRGTVMSIDEKWAIVFTEDCQLIRLPLKPDMAVGKETRINMGRKEARTVTISRRFRPALIAACFVLLLTVGLLFNQGLIFNPVYATVSIDVNPSLELTLNRQLTVISVKAMNQEAEQLIAGESFKGLRVEEAIYRWTHKLLASNQYQVKTMLLSAVIPDDAEALKTQLMHMEETQNQGELKNIAVRFIYTNDQAVARQAQKNNISIGRQMLLNQAEVQNQNFNAESIAIAPLGDLIQKLLQNQDRNQSRLTQRTTQSMSESGTGGTTATNRETNRETSRATTSNTGGTGSGATETRQYTNQYTNGNTTGAGTGSSATNQYTNQNTSGNPQNASDGTTSQQMSQQTSGSIQGTGSGTNATSQYASQSTNGSTQGSGTRKTGGSGNG